MFSVYVLKSTVNGSYYIGQSKDLDSRIRLHNNGKNRSTKAYRPYELVYNKEFGTRREAMLYEKELKGIKKRNLLEKIVSSN